MRAGGAQREACGGARAERARKRLPPCSISVSVRERTPAMISGQEAERPSAAIRSSRGLLSRREKAAEHVFAEGLMVSSSLWKIGRAASRCLACGRFAPRSPMLVTEHGFERVEIEGSCLTRRRSANSLFSKPPSPITKSRRQRRTRHEPTMGRARNPSPSRAPAADLRSNTSVPSPTRPKTNGKAERFIQTALREWAYARAYQTSDQRAVELPIWMHHYNWHRPHGGLKSNPPINRLGLSEDNLLRLRS